MQIKTVFWDFDGVLSKDFFYKSFSVDYPEVWKFINTELFGPTADDKVGKWMRAELTYDQINKFISRETGIDLNILTQKFVDDVSKMKIEIRHFPIIKVLKKQGYKVGLITNNMDVFDTITVPRLRLDKLFNGNIFNSYKFKKLKNEGLFEIAVDLTGCSDFNECLLIDDSAKARSVFEKLGGETYAYTDFENFRDWANQNLLK